MHNRHLCDCHLATTTRREGEYRRWRCSVLGGPPDGARPIPLKLIALCRRAMTYPRVVQPSPGEVPGPRSLIANITSRADSRRLPPDNGPVAMPPRTSTSIYALLSPKLRTTVVSFSGRVGDPKRPGCYARRRGTEYLLPSLRTRSVFLLPPDRVSELPNDIDL